MSVETLRFPGITSVQPVRDLGLTYQIGYTEFSKDWNTRKTSSIDPIINYELMLNGPKFTFTSASALCRTTCDQWLSTPGIPKNLDRITVNNEEILTCWDGVNTLYKITPEGREKLLTVTFSSLPGLHANLPNSSNNLSTIRLIYESSLALYYLIVWSNVDLISSLSGGVSNSAFNAKTSIIKINKSDLTNKTISGSASINVGFFNQTLVQIQDDEDKLVFFGAPRRPSQVGNGSVSSNSTTLYSEYISNRVFSIIIFNKSLGTIQEINSTFTFLNSNGRYPRGSTKPFDSTDNSKSIIVTHSSTSLELQFYRLTYNDETNFSSFPWSTNFIQLTLEGSELSSVINSTNPNLQFNLFDYTYNSNKYIIVFATPYGPLSLPSVTATTYKVVIYKLVGNTLTPVWSESIPDTHYVLLPNSDGTKFVLASETSLFYYKINGESLVKYAPRTFNPPLVRICYDESERLWCSTSQDLFILSESRHSDYMLRVGSPDRVVSGPFPVDSSLEVIVYNKNAIQVSVYVTLKAKNAIFTESGTDTLLLLTHISQPTSVPIKVTAPGNVKITAVGF